MGGLANCLAYWRHTGSEVRCEIGHARGTFDAHIACLYYSLIITDRYTAPSLVASHNQANERVRRKKKLPALPVTLWPFSLVSLSALLPPQITQRFCIIITTLVWSAVHRWRQNSTTWRREREYAQRIRPYYRTDSAKDNSGTSGGKAYYAWLPRLYLCAYSTTP